MKEKQRAKKIKQQEKLNQLFLQTLKNEGYFIEQWENEPTYTITGKRIYGFISFKKPEEQLSKEELKYLNYYPNWSNGMIVIDHKNCFNKASRCPCKLYLPTTKEKINYIIEQLKYWGSDEGFKLSNNYECRTWVDEYLNGKKRLRGKERLK